MRYYANVSMATLQDSYVRIAERIHSVEIDQEDVSLRFKLVKFRIP